MRIVLFILASLHLQLVQSIICLSADIIPILLYSINTPGNRTPTVRYRITTPGNNTSPTAGQHMLGLTNSTTTGPIIARIILTTTTIHILSLI
ncbi:hypothetical protein Y032_0116g586 [Ancylostoma ceylanicum]|uniref:7TM GPCR serpentine receptor class x (Srx) domain-containing protein n=1 Tax=Ancylostoma ceylanicum TaxID=53326 RepID=A0A016TCG6_9BILA|nr:hypothetical protein Y032_0116g586 [Ancylostoma ceylanicum]